MSKFSTNTLSHFGPVELVVQPSFTYISSFMKFNNNLQKAACDMLAPLRPHCTHAVSLTMKQAIWPLTENGRSCTKLDEYQARITLRHGMNRLNRKLWKSAAKRQTILVLPFLEGKRFRKRLHYHLQIGNLPHATRTETLTRAMKEAWGQTDFGDREITVKPLYNEHGWLGYSTKEVSVFNTDCVDWESLRIPQHLQHLLQN